MNVNIHKTDYMEEDELFDLLDQITFEKDDGQINDKSNDKNEINSVCAMCNSSENIFDDFEKGIVVCTNCGYVLCDILDKNPEWRQYDEDGKSGNARCNFITNLLFPQSSLGTTIAMGRSKVKTLHIWSSTAYKEKSLHIVLKDIQNICRNANILKCIEDDAKILYKNVSECKHSHGKSKGRNMIIRGRNRRSLIGACIFYACKRRNNIRSPKEIANIVGIRYKDITKGCKKFRKLMAIRKMSIETDTSTPEHFVERYCKALHIKNDQLAQTIQIAKNIQKLNIASTHIPLSVATGSILLMAEINDLPITRRLIANKFNISEVTVNKAFKKIDRYKRILISDELTNKISELLEIENKKIKLPDKLTKMYNSIQKHKGENKNNNIINYRDILFDFYDDDIEEYIDSISFHMYETFEQTDEKYNSLFL